MFKISPNQGLKAQHLWSRLQGTRGCCALAAPSHPPRFLSSAIRSTWGGRGGQCPVRDMTVPFLATMTPRWPRKEAVPQPVRSPLFPHNPQTSASLFLPGASFPSLRVFAQSEGAKGQGGVEGGSQGSLTAGGPILLPPAQPPVQTSGFQLRIPGRGAAEGKAPVWVGLVIYPNIITLLRNGNVRSSFRKRKKNHRDRKKKKWGDAA